MTLHVLKAGRDHRRRLGAADPWDPNNEGLSIWGAWLADLAGNFAGSLVDQSGNGNDLTDPGGVNTPAWNATDGWIFDGSASPNSDHLRTSFVPDQDQSQTLFVKFTNATKDGAICGSEDTPKGCNLVPRWGAAAYYINGGVQADPTGAFTTGSIALAGNRGYKDGVDVGLALPVWGPTVPTNTVWLGCRNAGGIAYPMAVYVQRFYIYSVTLTAAQVLAIHQANA